MCLAAAAGRSEFDRRVDERLKRRRRQMDLKLAGNDTGEIDQVLDDARLRPAGALDGVDGPGGAGAIEFSGREQSGPTEHRVQGRAQLVREGREKLVLHTVGSLCPAGLFVGDCEQPPIVDAQRRTDKRDQY